MSAFDSTQPRTGERITCFPTRGHSGFGYSLAPGNGPDNDKRLLPRRDRIGQWGIRRLMRQILLAGEEAQERPALLRDLVADRPAQHRIAGLKRVENRPQRDRAVELELHLAANVRQRSQMLRKNDSDQLRHRRDAPTLFRQALQELFEQTVKFLGIIDEQCVAVAVESFQSNLVAELRFQ